MSGAGARNGVTISFIEHYARSEQFDQVFRQGMTLVEETASYLDGAGRQEAKRLSPSIAVVYASESMRLTTRLLEIASWLLVRRSLKAGEITPEEARVKRRRIRLNTIARASHVAGFDELPDRLKALVERSYAFNDRIVQIDRALERQVTVADEAEQRDNPVGSQVEALSAAFGTAPRGH